MSLARSELIRNPGIPVVGIVGGVGAGKSSVVRSVTGLRLFVIDADRIGHELLLTDAIRGQLRDVFGGEIFDETGMVVRKRLAKKVFGDAERQSKDLSRLNQILHPAIRDEICRSIQKAPQDVDAIILDAALLLEAGWAEECDAILFVDTPLKTRQQRVAVSRGWSGEELERREALQWSLSQKRQSSHFVIDNSGTPEFAADQAKRILEQIINRHCTAERK